jgi:cell volume regulation protein A
VTLNERVAATLEIESGVNDPMAVYLTLAFIAVLVPQAPSRQAALGRRWPSAFVSSSAGVRPPAWSAASRWPRCCAGWRRATPAAASWRCWLVPAGLSTFAATGLAGGSGFLAVYLFGLIVANRAAEAVAPTLAAMDGYAWLAQAGMFLLLGLLVTPSTMLVTRWGRGWAVALVLIFVARPLAVWLCLLPFRFTPRETWFIAWVGLRGAVPIVLALFPLLAGTPHAMPAVQHRLRGRAGFAADAGHDHRLLARKLGVALPDPADERQVRAVFRDFVLDPTLPIGDVCNFYGLPADRSVRATRPSWLSISRASLSAAPRTAWSSVAASSVTVTGWRPSSRASMAQRLSRGPVLLPFSSLRWTSTRVTWSWNRRRACSTVAPTWTASASRPSMWASVFTWIFMAVLSLVINGGRWLPAPPYWACDRQAVHAPV